MIAQSDKRLSSAQVLPLAFKGGSAVGYRFDPDGPARGTIALVHGWGARAALMTAFLAPLLAAGYSVVAIDLPGHGAAGGRRLHVPLGVAALHALHAKTGPWHGMIGHSFGGALSASFIAGAVEGFTPVPINRLVLVATPNSMPDVFRQFGSAVGLSPSAQRRMERMVEPLSGHALDTFMIDDMVWRVRAPTLVMHAPDDKEVSFASAETLAKLAGIVSLKQMPGLGHRRICQSPEAARVAAAFMGNEWTDGAVSSLVIASEVKQLS